LSRLPVPLEDPIGVEYLAWCERQLQPANTLRRRRAVLRSIGNPGTATREEIEAWWETRVNLQAGGPRKGTSRANDLAIVRAFYTWCQMWEYRQDNPAVRLQPPKQRRGKPRPATRREFDQILAHIAALPVRGPALRRAVLLGTWAGLRVSEAAGLNWADIDLETRTAWVTGKGNKTREVTLATRLIEELGDPHAGNVVTGTATAWATTTLGHYVNGAIRDAGVPEGVRFHKLRHRYGSIGYQRVKDPRALADQMGHASVATTMSFYAAAADEAAQAIADAVVDE
jgi:integrase